MTKSAITIIDVAGLLSCGPRPMKFALFESSEWRRELDIPARDETVEVQLSTGKVIRSDSKFLHFLRVLAEELAAKEPKNH